MAAPVVSVDASPSPRPRRAYRYYDLVMASLIAYFCGEFCNSYVLAKMKLLTRGRFLWTRTIGSTIVGEAVDSLIFYPLAFLGVWSNDLVAKVLVSNYLLKVGWEAVMTPVTYRV